MARIYDDPAALAIAIKQAREAAGFNQQELADELGTSIGTVKRWETAKVESLGRSPAARRAVAAQVVEVTGAPREMLGLPSRGRGDRSTEQRLGVLELQMRTLLDLLDQEERIETQELREASDAVARQYDPSSEPREEPGTGAASE